MNRKLVNGLLLLSIATVGCGTFTSCKDTDEDWKNEVIVDQANLRADLQKQIDEINAKLAQIKSCDCDLTPIKNRLATIENWLNIAEGDANLDARIMRLIQESQVPVDLSEIEKAIKDLQDNKADASALKALSDKLDKDVENLTNQIKAVVERLNALITSIVNNQAYNHFFGTMNLPVGLESQIIGNYYGKAAGEVKFPLQSTVIEVCDPEAVAAAAEAGLTPSEVITIPAGEVYMDDTDNNLGQLYTTINPNNIDFSGTNLKLVKSNGEEAPITLTAAQSDEVLTHGWTRADNGFYRVDAKINKEDIESIALHLQPNFKSTVKDLLKNPGKQTIAQLGLALLDQMDGFTPAYGLKAPWTVDGKDYAVFSKYEIALAAIHPLGYESLSDVSTSKRLPTFGPLSETLGNIMDNIKDDIKIDLGYENIANIKINKFEIKDAKIELQLGWQYVYNDTYGESDWLYFEDPITLTYDPSVGKVTGTDGALNGLVNAIVDAVNEKLVGNPADPTTVENSLEAQINNLIDNINTQMATMQGNINEQLADILDKIQDQVSGKLGSAQKLVDKYNALAEKVNHFLENPNAYLQVALVYEDGNKELHRVSTNANDPSVFVPAGGNAIELFATSLTADVAAPSYKKYVAVTKAWNENGEEDASAVSAANAQLNKVIPGRQHRVAMNGVKPGYKYQIVYSSLDYRGKTSTRLFYITVKK